MPSTDTITSTDFTTFTARTKIKSAEMNANFSVFRGHNLPVSPTTSTASDLTYDLGSYTYSWRRGHLQELILNDLATTPSSNPTAGFYKIYAKSDGNPYMLDSAGTETQINSGGTATDQSYELSNLTLVATVAASALTVAIKTKAGNDPTAGSPVKIGFRNATAATGTYVQRSLTASLSVVVSSGSTLGHSSANAHWIYVYALDNAGTVELAVSSVIFDEGTVQNTTAEGGAGASDSNRVLYSTTARTGVAIRLIGRMKSSQATAGTWASTMTEISVMPFMLPTICAIYTTNATGSFSSGVDTRVDYEDKEYDPYNSVVTGGSWLFTAPATRIFRVTAFIAMATSSGWDLGDRVHLRVRKNGTVNRTLGTMYPGGNINNELRVWGSSDMHLSAGDTIYIEVEQVGGATTLNGTTSTNYVCITEVGF